MLLGICGIAGSGKNQLAAYIRQDFRFIEVALADPLKRIAQEVYAFTDDQLWGPSARRNAPDTRYPRPHTWVTIDGIPVCACCSQETHMRRIEDDVLLPDETDVLPCYLTPRYALQLLGTEWGRQCYPDTWVSYGVRTAQEILADPHALTYSPKLGILRPTERDLRDRDYFPPHNWGGVTIPDVRFENEMRVIREAGGLVVRIRRPGSGLRSGAGLHPSEVEQVGIPDRAFDMVIENDGTLADLRERARHLVETLRALPTPITGR